MRVRLKNSSGQIKEVKLGYSWTTFFFGFFVPLLRGDFRNFLIQFGVCTACVLADFIIPIIPILAFWGFNIFYVALNYNKMYTQTLIQKGFTPASETDEQMLISKGYLA